MNPIDRTTAIPALPNQGGQANVPGLRRLWLIEDRHVSGFTDPRTVPGALEGGFLLSDQGLSLTDDAVIHDWRFRYNQGQYEEKAENSVQGIAFSQAIKLVVPNDDPLTALACYRMTGRRWLAVYTDGNGLVRLVGTRKQSLRFDYGQAIGPNNRVLAFAAVTRLPGLYLAEADAQLLSGYLALQSDFSRL